MAATAAAATSIVADPGQGSRPTRVDVELDAGRARIRTLDQGSFMAARPLRVSGNRVRVALIGIHMSLLGGDEVDLRLGVGQDVILEVIEPVGMVAYNAEGRRSTWRLAASVGPGATLIWHGAQFVAAQGSNAHRDTALALGPCARVLVKEALVLGRSGESDVRLRSRMHVSLDERELLVEDLDLTADTRRAPGIVGPSRAIGTVIAAGWRPDGEQADPQRLDLAGPGALCRSLDAAAHRVDRFVDPVFEDWRKQALNRGT